MAKYEFEPNAIFPNKEKADPEVIGEVLQEITRKHDNRLRPEDVCSEARKRNHPLHRHLTWDNEKCGEIVRLDEARAIIRSIKIIAQDDVNQASAREYHSIQDNGRSYRSTTEIQTSMTLQLSLYLAALRDLKAWEKRYRNITHVCQLIGVAREQLEQTIENMKQPKPSRRRAATDESRPSV